MKLLLTSAGIKNASIHDALVHLLGKSTSDSSALCIPTGTPRSVPASWYGSSSVGKNPTARCASWVGSRWECWS
jgi:dipeptidase E